MSICPRCGASNPPENKFCGRCGQLLIAESPTSAQSDLPAWLRDDVDAAPPSALPPESVAAASETVPAWLSEIGVDDPPADNASPPPWLAELQQQPANETASSSTSQELPDWLRDLEPELQHSSPAAPNTEHNEIPSWINPTADRESPAQAADDVPAWMRDVDTPQAPTPAAAATPIPDAEPVPDWMNQSSPPAAADDLPDWLRADEPDVQPFALDEPAPPAARATDDQLPAWLSEHDNTPAPVRSEPVAASPAWLTDDNQNDADADVDLVVPDWGSELGTSAATGHQPATDEFPAWLHEETVEASAPADLPPVTNWLEEVSADQSFTAPGTNANTTTSDDLPSWLSDVTSPAPTPAPAGSTNGMPSWLAETNNNQSVPTADESDLPAWLQTEDHPEPSLPTPEIPADELPDWLAQESETAPTASDDTPSWLTATTEPLADPSATQALPSWLADNTAQPADPGATQALPSWLADNTAQPADPGATQALPSWLLDESAPTETVTPAPSRDDALPSWLQQTDEPAPQSDSGIPPWLAMPDEPSSDQHTAQAYESPANKGAANDALPAWLTAEPEATEDTRAPQAPSSSALPAWLDTPDDAAPSDGAHVYDTSAASEEAVPAANRPEAAQLPAWLNDDAAPSTNAPSTETSLPSWLDGIADEPALAAQSSTAALPTWLDTPDEQPATKTPAAPQSELLGGLELPAWLRDDRETPAAAPAPQEAPAWLERMTPEPETTSVAVVEAPPTPRVTRSPERVEAMTLLDQLKTTPPAEPAPAVPVRRRSRLLPIMLTLIALLLIGVIAWVLLSPRLPISFGVAPVLPAAGAQVAEAINNLPANRPVVLAYEWDAQRIGDLRPLEDVLIGQLTARTDVPLVFVSTDPQGALLAGERATRVRTITDNFHDLYGIGLVNLGFKPGGILALRRYANNGAFGELFARDAYGNDLRANDVTMQSVCGAATADGCAWSDVGLLVVMVDDVDDVRGWFEQLRSQYPDLQTLVLTPAEIEPQVQPYTSLPNVLSLSGIEGAYAYTTALGLNAERIGQRFDATAIGTSIWSIVLILGAIPAIIAGRRTQRNAENDAWDR